MRALTTLFIVFAAIGCNDPYQRAVPPDPKTWGENTEFMEALQKLPDDDKKAVAGYGLRTGLAAAFGATGAAGPPGMTVKEVIEAQKKWQEEQARVEAERAALKAKVEAEQAALRTQMNDVLTVAVTKLEYKKINYQDFIAVVVAFDNKSDKPLAGAKGRVVFADMFGDDIKTVNLSYDEGIPAKATKTWSGQIDFNQFRAEDKKLATTPLDKLKIDWQPQVYLFTDGTKLEMPSMD